MKYLVKPFRFLIAVLILILNAYVFKMTFIALAIWNLNFKFIPKLLEEYFECFHKSGRLSVYSSYYLTFWDYVNNKKINYKQFEKLQKKWIQQKNS
jgi:hypothetical protein